MNKDIYTAALAQAQTDHALAVKTRDECESSSEMRVACEHCNLLERVIDDLTLLLKALPDDAKCIAQIFDKAGTLVRECHKSSREDAVTWLREKLTWECDLNRATHTAKIDGEVVHV